MAKKSRASKAPFLKPTIPIHFQVDFPKSGFIETNINKYGCYFLSLLAIPQFFTKQALSQPDIIQLYKECNEQGYMGPNCFVSHAEKIVQHGALYLGDSKHSYRLMIRKSFKESHPSFGESDFANTDNLPGGNNVWYVIVDFPTKFGQHFQLFNGVGGLIYDPGNGIANTSYRGNVNKIDFYKIEKL